MANAPWAPVMRPAKKTASPYGVTRSLLGRFLLHLDDSRTRRPAFEAGERTTTRYGFRYSERTGILPLPVSG